MALMKCPECGNEISDKAKKCPRCGYPIKTNSLNRRKKLSSAVYLLELL